MGTNELLEEAINAPDDFDSNEYSELFEHMFTDLRTLSKGDKEIFSNLYYNRDADFAEFKTATKNLFETGHNIVIIGDAGIGKSDYIHRLIYDALLLEDARLFPIMIDYRKQNNMNSMKLRFIECMGEYFNTHAQKITLSQDVEHNLHIIQEALFAVSSTTKKKHPVIFIDDLDYAEQEDLFPILKLFIPYAKSQNISIVLSVRPTLHKTLQRNDGTYSHYFTRSVKIIKLSNLCVRNILAMRLAPILAFSTAENKGLLKNVLHVLTSLMSGEKKYEALLKRLGINNLEELKKFQFPFTDEYSTFMREISSNNIREAFDIAYISLLFILDNYEELENEKDPEISENRKKITQEQIIELFSKEGGRYTIFDLHKLKSSTGNSLYYNVLEAIAFCHKRNLDVKFYERLEKMGHSKESVDNELKILARKSNRFLSANDFTYAQDDAKEPIEYKLTVKGRFYLFEMSQWAAYKNKFDRESPTRNIKDLIESVIAE